MATFFLLLFNGIGGFYYLFIKSFDGIILRAPTPLNYFYPKSLFANWLILLEGTFILPLFKPKSALFIYILSFWCLNASILFDGDLFGKCTFGKSTTLSYISSSLKNLSFFKNSYLKFYASSILFFIFLILLYSSSWASTISF